MGAPRFLEYNIIYVLHIVDALSLVVALSSSLPSLYLSGFLHPSDSLRKYSPERSKNPREIMKTSEQQKWSQIVLLWKE